MSLAIAERERSAEQGFARMLREWRQRRRMSQLELALSSGVSQRHVSFLESGRARPSRNMILQLSEALDVPLRDRNDWLAAAGFAPAFRARPLDDPQMRMVMGAIRMMLKSAEPFPALAIDRAWNIRMANRPFEAMAALVGGDLWTRVGGEHRNLMRLFFHPEGLRPFITNWGAIAPVLWQRAQREAEALGGEEMKRVLAELAPLQDERIVRPATDAPLVPVLPVDLEKDGVRVSLFTVVATFGTAQDVTADELRIETLFPADESTEQLFRGMAATA